MVHIGKLVKKVFEQRGFTVSAFARKINKSRENIYDIFTRKTIDTGLLEIIGKALDHDFFQYFNSSCRKEKERLQEENDMLREMIRLLREKNRKK